MFGLYRLKHAIETTPIRGRRLLLSQSGSKAVPKRFVNALQTTVLDRNEEGRQGLRQLLKKRYVILMKLVFSVSENRKDTGESHRTS